MVDRGVDTPHSCGSGRRAGSGERGHPWPAPNWTPRLWRWQADLTDASPTQQRHERHRRGATAAIGLIGTAVCEEWTCRL